MNHLTPEQLTAHLDGAESAATRAETEQHLAGCAACRETLAELAALDASLGRALTHEPGEEYFAKFADRVEQRLRASGLRGAQARGADERERPWMEWLRSPRRMAWIGAMAAVIGGAAIVLVTSREDRLSAIDASRATREPAGPAAAPPAGSDEHQEKKTESSAGGPVAERAAPAPGAAAANAPARQQAPSMSGNAARASAERSGAPRSEARKTASPSAMAEKDQTGAASRAGATPQRMMEVRKDASGNWVPAQPAPALQFATPPGAAPGPATGGVRVKKPGMATPLDAQKDQRAAESPQAGAQAPATESSADKLEAGEVALCGDVVDASGRAVAGASVTLAATGHVTFSRADGHFCTGAPAGDHELIVHAVGFAERRIQVHVGGDLANVQVALDAVSVLGDGVKLAKGTTPGGAASLAAKPPVTTTGANADPFAGLPDSTRQAASDAQRLSMMALGSRSAAAFELAAGCWERLLDDVPGRSAAAVTARYRVAEARYGAWDVEPTADRARAAGQTLDAFLAVAPEGAQRDLATRWKAALKH